MRVIPNEVRERCRLIGGFSVVLVEPFIASHRGGEPHIRDGAGHRYHSREVVKPGVQDYSGL